MTACVGVKNLAPAWCRRVKITLQRKHDTTLLAGMSVSQMHRKVLQGPDRAADGEVVGEAVVQVPAAHVAGREGALDIAVHVHVPPAGLLSLQLPAFSIWGSASRVFEI